VKHVRNYPGGISGGVRAYVSPAVQKARATIAWGAKAPMGAETPAPYPPASDVPMNTDSNPPMPQNETAVATDPNNPAVAVAAANDYVSGGVWIGRTTDGGHTWSSYFAAPAVSKTGEGCFGGDPSLVYSVRDSAFYLGQLCFQGTRPTSEIQVWKSVDDGATWTPPSFAAVAVSNVANASGKSNPAVFYDKDELAVDNNPSSPYYGRLYVGFTKFHIQPNGFSDYCPINITYTNNVPTQDPANAHWVKPVSVVADKPGGNGLGESADQFAMPVVDNQNGVDMAYVLEGCNVATNFGIRFKRSTNGGATWPAKPKKLNAKGFHDITTANGNLPPKNARGGMIESMAYDPAAGTDGSLDLVYQNWAGYTGSRMNITFQQSTDFGASWSTPKFISLASAPSDQTTPAAGDQFQPWVTALTPSSTNHDIYAIWYDTRNDPNNLLIQEYYALSSDNGATWTNAQVSPVAWNPNWSFFGSGDFIGDYTAIAANDSYVYPVWTDGRSNTGPSSWGQTDIYTNQNVPTPP
jgi:hypothetical protein